MKSNLAQTMWDEGNLVAWAGLVEDNDRAATSIANALVKALTQLEHFDGDPAVVLATLQIAASNAPQGVKDAVTALRQHYLAEESK